MATHEFKNVNGQLLWVPLRFTGVDASAPTAPANLRIVGVAGQTDVTMTWDASNDDVGVTGYQVSKDGSTTWVAVDDPANRRETDNTGNTAGSTHTYRVRAMDASGKFSNPSNTLTVTFAPVTGDTQNPSVPGSLRLVGSPTSSSVTMTWNASTDDVGVTKYEVSKDGSATWTPVSNFAARTHTDSTGNSASEIHGYRVRAGDASGKFSAPSNTLSVTFAPTTTFTPALLGLSCKDSDFPTRLAIDQSTGGRIQVRRIFFGSFNSTDAGQRANISEAKANGWAVVISFKYGISWKNDQDTAANSIKTYLASLAPMKVFVTINHEPGKVGHNPLVTDNPGFASDTPEDFDRMMRHNLPIFKSAGSHVFIGPIMNGWMWTGNTTTSPASGQGYSDAELARWMSPELRQMCDFIAADDYQGGNDAASAGPDQTIRTTRRVLWGQRMGDVRGYGIGEFNAFDATFLRNQMEYVKSIPNYLFACCWDNAAARAGFLTGDRLAVYQDELLHWND